MQLLKSSLFCLLVSVIAVSANAQTLPIAGQVIDKKTREPLPYASIRIAGKSLGTVANENGEFTFLIPEEFKNEIVRVSMLGYDTYESPVWSLQSTSISNAIMLTVSPKLLNEVTVKDSLTGRDILELTFNRINENYTSKPFLMHSFYRDIKKVGGTYVSLFEAAIKIFDDSFKEPRNKFKLHESVELIEARRSLGYDNKFTSYFKKGNLIESVLLQNPVRYYLLSRDNATQIKNERKPDSFYNEEEIFVVEQTTDKYTAKLFINKKYFSIVRIEWTEPISNNVIERNKNLTGYEGGTKKIFDYIRIDEKMYLNYIIINSKIRWLNNSKNELKFETELLQQLLVNEIDINTRERIIPEKRMRSSSLNSQKLRYNKSFWEMYNLIKEPPENKRIIEDLNANGISNASFEKN